MSYINLLLLSCKHENKQYVMRSCLNLTNTELSPSFSIFRYTKEVEALTYYKQLNVILTLLVESSSSLSQDDKLQAVCDTVREHPIWNCAHVAAYVGLFEAFKNPEIQK